MPSFEFSRKHEAFVKECSSCDEVYIGTRSQKESETIFRQFFSLGDCSDGFQSRCQNCSNPGRKKLGITSTSIRKMLALQGGKCGICSKDISIEHGEGTQVRACVDHDDTTSTIRGLLCNDCNRAIGLLKHDQKILEAAISYLNGTIELKEVG